MLASLFVCLLIVQLQGVVIIIMRSPKTRERMAIAVVLIVNAIFLGAVIARVVIDILRSLNVAED